MSVERPQLFPPWVLEFWYPSGFCHCGGSRGAGWWWEGSTGRALPAPGGGFASNRRCVPWGGRGRYWCPWAISLQLLKLAVNIEELSNFAEVAAGFLAGWLKQPDPLVQSFSLVVREEYHLSQLKLLMCDLYQLKLVTGLNTNGRSKSQHAKLSVFQFTQWLN